MSNQSQQYPPPPQQRPGNQGRTLVVALSAVAAVLAVVLVALVAVGLSGGSDSENASADSGTADNGGAAPAAFDAEAPCKVQDSSNLDLAAWTNKRTNGGKRQPTAALMLTAQHSLPPEFSPLADPEPNRALTQYQDRSVGVITMPEGGQGFERLLAEVDQEGNVVEVGEYASESALPDPFDLANQYHHGYYRIETAGQIQIPAQAAGNETNMAFATALLPDAFDDERFWLLLRGSDNLYEAALYQNVSGFQKHGEPFGDLTQCRE